MLADPLLAAVLPLAVDVSMDLDPAAGVAGSAIGSFVTTFVVGAILLAVAPDYTRRMGERVRDEPLGTFLYGLVVLLFLVLVTLVLVLTVIGILVALPLVLVAFVVWAVGSAVAYLAIGEALVGAEDALWKPLAVGAALNGLLALTGVGGVVAFCIGAAGFGAVLQNWLD